MFLLEIFYLKDNVYLSGLLFVPKTNKFYFWIRKKLILFSFKNVTKIFVYSKQEIEFYSTIFPALSSKFFFVKYGRDYDIFENKKYFTNIDYIASGGISNRDYDVLLRAFSILQNKYPNQKCKIATRPNALPNNQIPNNVEVLFDIILYKFGSFLMIFYFLLLYR